MQALRVKNDTARSLYFTEVPTPALGKVVLQVSA